MADPHENNQDVHCENEDGCLAPHLNPYFHPDLNHDRIQDTMQVAFADRAPAQGGALLVGMMSCQEVVPLSTLQKHKRRTLKSRSGVR